MVDDLAFFVCQLFEGHVGAHAHCAADVGHKREHECLPRCHGALVDGERFVGHERRFIHMAYEARAVACGAGALAVEGQFFGAGGIEVGAAFGADQLAFGGYVDRGREVMPVGATVAGESRIH